MKAWSKRFAACALAMVVAVAMCVPAVALAAPAKVTLKAGKAAKVTLYADSATQNVANLAVKGKKAAKGKWTTSKKKVATVKKGKVTAKKKGKTTITVKYGKKKFTATVTVKNVAINKKTATLTTGGKLALGLTGDQIKGAKSSDASVASVAANGAVTANKAGKATITLTSKKGKNYTCAVTVKAAVTGVSFAKPELAMKPGDAVANAAAVAPNTSANKKVAYKSSDDKVATVDATGKITAVAAGAATITATAEDGGATATCKVTVEVPTVAVTSVAFAKSDLAMKTGDAAVANAATVEPADATNKAVSYASSDEDVATVDAAGVVTPIGVGSATITATTADGDKTATCQVVVLPGSLEVSNLDEMKAALAKLDLDKGEFYEAIKLVTSDSKVAIEGLDTYAESLKNTILTVDAPNASVDNHVQWKQVDIQAIAPDTYTEHADNFVCLRPANGHVVVGKGASPSIQVLDSVKNLHIENNGTIADLKVNTDGTIQLTGTNSGNVPVTVEAAVTIKTSIPLALNFPSKVETSVVKKATLVLYPGSTGTTVTTFASEAPAVLGLGTAAWSVLNNAEIVVDSATLVASYDQDVAKQAEEKVLRGSVQDADGNQVSGAKVYLFNYSEDFALEQYRETATAKPVASTDDEGNYSFANVKAGNYTLVVAKDGYQVAQQQLRLHNDTDEQYAQMITLIPATAEAKTGSIAGQIIDSAETGSVGIEGITLRVRAGANNVSGDVVARTTTDAKGNYTVADLEPGVYTVEAVDLRGGEAVYLSNATTVTVLAGEVASGGLGLTQAVDEGELRFILHWNDRASGAPSDLDSHLRGPDGQGGVFHVYYSDDRYNSENSAADLDRDDTDWVGPETITVRKEADGLYHYLVHDFSNGGSLSSRALSTSGAWVEVYSGEKRLQTFNVPTNKLGTVWYVCTYDPATKAIATVNEMGFDNGSSTVGEDAVYGSLRLTGAEKNDFVKDSTIKGSRLILHVAEDMDESKMAHIKPICEDPDAKVEVLHESHFSGDDDEDEDGSDSGYCVKLSNGNLIRYYSIDFTTYYGDLAITALEKNSVVTGYSIEQDDPDHADRINVTAAKTDFESYKDYIKPTIADKTAKYEVVEDDGYDVVRIYNDKQSRTYRLYVEKDWQGLDVVSVRSTDEDVVRDAYLDGNEIRIEGSLKEFGEAGFEKYLNVTYGEAVISHKLVKLEDDEFDTALEIANAAGETRRYYINYFRSWGDLRLVSATAKDDRITSVECYDEEIEFYGSGIELTKDNFDSLLDVAYGKDVVSHELYVENGYLYIVLKDADDRTRYCGVRYYNNWDDLYIDDVSSRHPDVSDVSYFNRNMGESSIYLYLDAAPFSEDMISAENLEFTFPVDTVTGSWSKDGDDYLYTIEDSANPGITRVYRLEVSIDWDNADWGELRLTDASAKNSAIIDVSCGDGNLSITGMLDELTAENFDDYVTVSYGDAVVKHELLVDEDDELYILLTGDNGRERRCYINYDREQRITSVDTNDFVKAYKIDYARAEIVLQVIGDMDASKVDQIVVRAGDEAVGSVYYDEHDGYASLNAGEYGCYEIFFTEFWDGLEILDIASTDEDAISEADFAIEIYLSGTLKELTSEDLERYLSITYGDKVASHEFRIGEDGDDMRLVLTDVDGNEHQYPIIYTREWGDLRIVDVESKDAGITRFSWWDDGINAHGTIDELTIDNFGDYFDISFGKDVADYRLEDGEDGLCLVLVGDDGSERRGDIYYHYDWGDLYIDDVSSDNDAVLEVWANEGSPRDGSEIHLSLSGALTTDVLDSLEFVFGSYDVEGTWSEDGDGYRYTITDSSNPGQERVYRLVAYVTYPEDLQVDYVEYGGDGSFSWGAEDDNLFIYADVKTFADVKDSLTVVYPSDATTGEFVYSEEDDAWSLVLTGEGGQRVYNVVFDNKAIFLAQVDFDDSGIVDYDESYLVAKDGVFSAPKLTLTLGGKVLKQGEDYTVELGSWGDDEQVVMVPYEDVQAGEEYFLYLQGKGEYTENTQYGNAYVAVEGFDMDDVEVRGGYESEFQVGESPYFDLYYHDCPLSEGVEYAVTYETVDGESIGSISEAGEGDYVALIDGIGNFSGQIQVPFRFAGAFFDDENLEDVNGE